MLKPNTDSAISPSADTIPIHTDCIDVERLQAYLAGWADEDSMKSIEKHLEQCADCETRIADLESHGDHPFRSNGQEPPTNEVQDPLVAEALEAAKYNLRATNSMDLDQFNLVNASTTVLPSFMFTELGPYDLIKPLGRGGMGMVYLAKHRRLNRDVALKILPNAFVDDGMRARFDREIDAAGKLKHPAIVLATDAGQAKGIQYLAMEFIQGVDLSRLARIIGPIEIADACEIGRQVALGLASAHACGIVHRDIKPSNIMLDASGSIKILDFGLALLDRWDGLTSELTTVGQFLGTLDYMAPEQAERCGSVDYRADLYALGATLFKLLCGRAPLAASPNQSPLEKLRLLAHHQPPSLRTVRPDAPVALVQLVDTLLSTDPNHRPPSADHVAELLNPLVANADLKQLAESAVNASVDLPTSAAVPISASRQYESQPKASAEGSNDHRRSSRRWLAAAALPLLAFAGYLIYLQTQQGNLVIESEVADVQVTILRNGESVKDFSIQTGNMSTRLRADRYEIVIQSPSDGLSVENDHFTLQRGQTVVARIRKSSDSNLSVAKSQFNTKLNRDIVEPGDTLAIYIEGILPFTPPNGSVTPPPVLQVDNHPPATGYPIQVDMNGDITMPLAGQIRVAGKTVIEVREMIREEYLKRKILKEDGTRVLAPLVSIFLKHGEVAMVSRNGVNSKQSTPTRQAPSMKEVDTVEPGDTLAIYLESILPFTPPDQPPAPPNVIQFGDRPPVIGYPIPVAIDGTITLPLVDQIDVRNLSTVEVRELIRKTYLDQHILKEDGQRKIAPVVSMLCKNFESGPIVSYPTTSIPNSKAEVAVLDPSLSATAGLTYDDKGARNTEKATSLYKGKSLDDWLAHLQLEKDGKAWLEAFHAVDHEAPSDVKHGLNSSVFEAAFERKQLSDPGFCKKFSNWISSDAFAQMILGRFIETDAGKLSQLLSQVATPIHVLDVPEETWTPIWEKIDSLQFDVNQANRFDEKEVQTFFARVIQLPTDSSFETKSEGILNRAMHVAQRFPRLGHAYLVRGISSRLQSVLNRPLPPAGIAPQFLQRDWAEAMWKSSLPLRLSALEDENDSMESRIALLDWFSDDELDAEDTLKRFVPALNELMMHAASDQEVLFRKIRQVSEPYGAIRSQPRKDGTDFKTRSKQTPFSQTQSRLGYAILLSAIERLWSPMRKQPGLDKLIAATQEAYDQVRVDWISQFGVADLSQLSIMRAPSGSRGESITTIRIPNGKLMASTKVRPETEPLIDAYLCHRWANDLRETPVDTGSETPKKTLSSPE